MKLKLWQKIGLGVAGVLAAAGIGYGVYKATQPKDNVEYLEGEYTEETYDNSEDVADGE